jgi:hypothetical protein
MHCFGDALPYESDCLGTHETEESVIRERMFNQDPIAKIEIRLLCLAPPLAVIEVIRLSKQTTNLNDKVDGEIGAVHLPSVGHGDGGLSG